MSIDTLWYSFEHENDTFERGFVRTAWRNGDVGGGVVVFEARIGGILGPAAGESGAGHLRFELGVVEVLRPPSDGSG